MAKLTYRQMKENIKKHLEESRPNHGEFDSNQSVFNFERESPELLREGAEDAPAPYPVEGAEGDFYGWPSGFSYNKREVMNIWLHSKADDPDDPIRDAEPDEEDDEPHD